MLKKMLVVSVATAGLACGAAFAGGSTAMPMAMSGPWGMTVDFGIQFNKDTQGAGVGGAPSTDLLSVPVSGSVTYIDFADMFRVDAGIGFNLKYDAYDLKTGNKTTVASQYGFKVRYEMLHAWGSRTWFTYGLGARVYGNGNNATGKNAAGKAFDNSQVSFNVNANIGFMRALTNHSLVNFVVPVIGYTYAGATDYSATTGGTFTKEDAYSSFRFFDGFTIGYTYLF